jgi:cell division protein FtsZ
VQAERGLKELQECVDTLITIPNERLLSTVPKDTSMSDAFVTADDVLRQAIQGISDLILVPGIINLDFADVRTIMSRMGIAIMGTGVASGEGRAKTAALAAVSSPLLEDSTVSGARGVIINVTGGPDLTLAEVSEASDVIYSAAHEDANIIFGAVVNPAMEGHVKITVIATGFDQARAASAPAVQASVPTPIDMSAYSSQRLGDEERRVVTGAPLSSSRFTLSRRAPIELSSLPVALTSNAEAGGDEEDRSPLDVPAFLRRQEG